MKQRKTIFILVLFCLLMAMSVTAAPVLEDKLLNYTTPYSDGVYHSWVICTGDENLTAVRNWYLGTILISTSNNSIENNTWTEVGGGTYGAYVAGTNITFEVWCINNDTKEQSTHENMSYVVVNYPVDFDGYEIVPTVPSYTDDINVSLNCSDIHDKADVLTGYVGLYKNGAYNETINKIVVNATMTLVYTLDSTWTSAQDTWTFEMWCGDVLSNTTKSNVSTTISGDELQDEVREASLILNSIMAILILGAIIIPAGLIIAILNGNMDMSAGIVTVVTLMGLAILIMMFYFIKSAIIGVV